MTVAGAATHAATIDRAALTLTIERLFSAPRERVFAALSASLPAAISIGCDKPLASMAT